MGNGGVFGFGLFDAGEDPTERQVRDLLRRVRLRMEQIRGVLTTLDGVEGDVEFAQRQAEPLSEKFDPGRLGVSALRRLDDIASRLGGVDQELDRIQARLMATLEDLEDQERELDTLLDQVRGKT